MRNIGDIRDALALSDGLKELVRRGCSPVLWLAHNGKWGCAERGSPVQVRGHDTPQAAVAALLKAYKNNVEEIKCT